jgi:hypothetical protein
MRFDGHRYCDCRWCQGRGCIYCKAEADKAAFPDGPKPMATFPATAEGMEAARKAIGIEAIRRAFGPGGGGISEIAENCKREGQASD